MGECKGVRRVFERKRERGKEKRSDMAGQEGESEIFVRCVVGIKWGRWEHVWPKKSEFLYLFIYYFVTGTLQKNC